MRLLRNNIKLLQRGCWILLTITLGQAGIELIPGVQALIQ